MGKRRHALSRRFQTTVLADPLSDDFSGRGSRSSTKRMGMQGLAEENEDTVKRARLMFDDGIQDQEPEVQPVIDEADLPGDEDPAEWQEVDQGEQVPNSQQEALPSNLQKEEAFVHALRDLNYFRRNGRSYTVSRSWTERRQRNLDAWDAAFIPLVDAYCQWKYSAHHTTPHHSDPINANACAENDQTAQTYSYTFRVYDIFTLDVEKTVMRPASSTIPLLDMAAAGYLGKTPVNPTVGTSFRTLELLYRLRQRQPSLSIEAFMKVVCDYYSMPYRRHLRTVLADSFEVYLRILRAVRKRVFSAFGWDKPDWRPLNACRACCYKLEDEPPLKFSRLYAFDGNNSLKRMLTVGGRQAADVRVWEGDYFLQPSYVDQFANEVRKSQKGPYVPQDAEDDGSDDDSIDGDAGDPTDGAGIPTVDGCAKNWKANAAEEKKRMWSMFHESGIFMGACRHHMITWSCDMIRSGELAKYPLAILNKTLDTHEPRTMGGFDIGCAFASTVKNSSLASKFQQKEASLCVNAFHGYSHNYPCQLKNHPTVIEGMGLEDLETMERIFSSTNRLASVTRYMSPYRRSLFIETYLQQWDEEKYANLGTFIFNNIQQAWKVIKEDTATLEASMRNKGVTYAQLDEWEKEQQTFFGNLEKPPTYDMHAVTYVELLEELRELAVQRYSTTSEYADSIATNYHPGARDAITFVAQEYSVAHETISEQISKTRRLETARRQANAQYLRVEYDVLLMEARLGIPQEKRWTRCDSQYITALRFIQQRKYNEALHKLQSLVIKRLFELHKLNLAQTGYKMRTHIAKSLQTRCKAIRRAVAAYNKAAVTADPPRKELDWSVASKLGFVEQFGLLEDTDMDIREKLWTKPMYREMIKLRQRIVRAHEEVVRCTVEARRLHTAIRDEAYLFKKALDSLKTTDPILYGAVEEFVLYRLRINGSILDRIRRIYEDRRYTGSKQPGIRAGNLAMTSDEEADNVFEVPMRGIDQDEEDEDDSKSICDDEDLLDDIGGLIQFSQLAL
ncbi:hypothetical protein NM688_g6049 [Phlebia brevispora]|uniref:Uncharacterized protein n=1 Tax=Phlebia brevispora TaxID=194682 RepID=A0ACC1SKL7_9APHY|nr:hypothetical protein NM688_g6049 [Phlebia brevispora]